MAVSLKIYKRETIELRLLVIDIIIMVATIPAEIRTAIITYTSATPLRLRFPKRCSVFKES